MSCRSRSSIEGDVNFDVMEEGLEALPVLPPGLVPDVSRSYHQASDDRVPAVAETTFPYPAVLHLNVGGRRLTTTVGTLQKDPKSVFCEMFKTFDSPADAFSASTKHCIVERDADGAYVIDRDGRLFHHILNYLRDGSVPIGLTRIQRLQLLQEARFYGLQSLYAVVGGLQQPHDVGVDVAMVLPARDAGSTAPLRAGIAHSRGGSPARPSDSRRGGPGPATSSYTDAPGAGAQSRGYSPRRTPLHVPVHLPRPGDGAQERREKAQEDAVAAGFLPPTRGSRRFARLRHGHEYNGDWIVSSPRNLPGVEYEAHGACLSRAPIDAMNKMSKAGWSPCEYPPRMPPQRLVYTSEWMILMYRVR